MAFGRGNPTIWVLGPLGRFTTPAQEGDPAAIEIQVVNLKHAIVWAGAEMPRRVGFGVWA